MLLKMKERTFVALIHDCIQFIFMNLILFAKCDRIYVIVLIIEMHTSFLGTKILDVIMLNINILKAIRKGELSLFLCTL